MTTFVKKMYDSLEKTDIRQNILAIGSGEMKLWARAVRDDEKLFNQLFQLVFSGEHRVAWRSCWIIDTASEETPGLLDNKLTQIIAGMMSTADSSLKRHFARILCRYQIPEEYLGAIVNRCFELLAPSEPAAVRVYAMQLLFNIARLLPDIKGELISVIERMMEEGGTAGFNNRSEKLLRQLRPQ